MNRFLSKINSLCPKAHNIIFNSYPDVSGNALFLYRYIVLNRPDIKNRYRLIWTVGDMQPEKAKCFLQKKTGMTKHAVVPKKSIRGGMLYFTSEFLVSTHGYFPTIQTSEKQMHLNLWHGMPFKRIGRMLEPVHTNGKSDEADMTIATSATYQRIMADSFGLDKGKVIITGQPCDDMLNSPNQALKAMNIDRGKFSKIIMWMPTYRKSVVGDIREDGRVNSFGVNDVMGNHFLELNEALDSNDYLLIIKPHPMDALCSMQFPDSGNIRVLLNADLAENDVELYELLENCDVLLTDYSSVFIDWLVTGKPMAFVCGDFSEYEETRGFCFDSPRDYMPGELITNYEGLIHYFSSMDEINNQWRMVYEKVKEEFNPYSDSDACKRVCDAIWGAER